MISAAYSSVGVSTGWKPKRSKTSMIVRSTWSRAVFCAGRKSRKPFSAWGIDLAIGGSFYTRA